MINHSFTKSFFSTIKTKNNKAQIDKIIVRIVLFFLLGDVFLMGRCPSFIHKPVFPPAGKYSYKEKHRKLRQNSCYNGGINTLLHNFLKHSQRYGVSSDWVLYSYKVFPSHSLLLAQLKTARQCCLVTDNAHYVNNKTPIP